MEPCGEDYCVQAEEWDKYCVDGSCEPFPQVLCPGFPATDYCDCGSDCEANEAFCGCEAAQAEDCCGGGPQ